MIDIFPHLKKHNKKLNGCFFLDTIKVRSFKLCMIINFIGLYIFALGLMTLTLFQGHRYVKYKLQIACFGFLSSVV